MKTLMMVMVSLLIGSNSQAFIKFSTPKNPRAATKVECSQKCCDKTKTISRDLSRIM